jgi:phage shock protein PspC (stress-responsive transcriptional regulator)
MNTSTFVRTAGEDALSAIIAGILYIITFTITTAILYIIISALPNKENSFLLYTLEGCFILLGATLVFGGILGVGFLIYFIFSTIFRRSEGDSLNMNS